MGDPIDEKGFEEPDMVVAEEAPPVVPPEAPPKPKKKRKKAKRRAAPRRATPVDKRALESAAVEKPAPVTGDFICTQKCYVWPKLYRPGNPATFTKYHTAPQKDGKVVCFVPAVPGVNVERPVSVVKVTGIGDG